MTALAPTGMGHLTALTRALGLLEHDLDRRFELGTAIARLAAFGRRG